MLHLLFLLVNSKPIFPAMIIKRIEVYMIIHKICMKFLMNFMSEKFIILGVCHVSRSPFLWIITKLNCLELMHYLWKCKFSDESNNGQVVSLSISVERAKGRFESIVVKWDMTPGTGTDLSPVSGTITFGVQQDKGFIHLQSGADTVSRDLQVQTVNDNVSLICDIIVCCHGESQCVECVK